MSIAGQVRLFHLGLLLASAFLFGGWQVQVWQALIVAKRRQHLLAEVLVIVMGGYTVHGHVAAAFMVGGCAGGSAIDRGMALPD